MTMDRALEVRFWGVRGSLPSPGADTALVGGNTSCVEVTAAGSRVILDAGSGLRALGDRLIASGEQRETTMLLSHVHWDHVMGLPFFGPLYMPGCELTIASGPLGVPLRDVLRRQMTQPLFPIEFSAVESRVKTIDLDARQRFRVGALEVSMLALNHPDPVFAYRLDYAGRSVVYATDTEHEEGRLDEQLVEFARGTDALIYDAQYTPEEYRGEVGPSRKGWGHSTFEAGAEVARAAGAKTLVLFHHDPRRNDDAVSELLRRARGAFENTVAARESLALRFEANAFEVRDVA